MSRNCRDPRLPVRNLLKTTMITKSITLKFHDSYLYYTEGITSVLMGHLLMCGKLIILGATVGRPFISIFQYLNFFYSSNWYIKARPLHSLFKGYNNNSGTENTENSERSPTVEKYNVNKTFET